MELPIKAFERLKQLKEKTEATSYTEVTKNSYRIYERIIEAETILVKDKDGNTKEVELL
jgi:hypothetical protein